MDSSVGSRLWGVGPAFRLDLENPYLRLQNLTLFVRDQDRSLRFFVDLLGFSLIADRRVPEQSRWVAVAPPDGTAILALVTPKPDQEEYGHIGQARQIVLMTEDVDAIYQLWLERGVSFLGSAREFGETANWRRLERFCLPGMACSRIPALSRQSEAATS